MIKIVGLHISDHARRSELRDRDSLLIWAVQVRTGVALALYATETLRP